MNTAYELVYFVKKWATPSWKLDGPISYCDMTFILSGEATYTDGNQVFHLCSGDAVFLPNGTFRHAQTNGMECVAFNFKTDHPPFSGATSFSWGNDPVLKLYFDEFNQHWIDKSTAGKLHCDGLFLLILSRLLQLQQQKQIGRNVSMIIDFLHRHYTEKITVQQVAQEMNLSTVYCGAVFSKEMGESILHYTNRLRVTKSQELLQCTPALISEIASDVGIDDVYYFCRVFKSIVGISPQQYRQHNFKT